MTDDLLPPQEGAGNPLGVRKSLHPFEENSKGNDGKGEEFSDDSLPFEDKLENQDAFLEGLARFCKKHPVPDPNKIVTVFSVSKEAILRWGETHGRSASEIGALEATDAEFRVKNPTAISFATVEMYQTRDELQETKKIERNARAKAARTPQKLWLNDKDNQTPWEASSKAKFAMFWIGIIVLHIFSAIANGYKFTEVIPAFEESFWYLVGASVGFGLFQFLIPSVLHSNYKNYLSEEKQARSRLWAQLLVPLFIIGCIPFFVDFTPQPDQLKDVGDGTLQPPSWLPLLEFSCIILRLVGEIALAFLLCIECQKIWRSHRRSIDNPDYLEANALITKCGNVRHLLNERGHRLMAINDLLYGAYLKVMNETYQLIGTSNRDFIRPFCQILEEARNALHDEIKRS